MEKQENLEEIRKPKHTSLILCTMLQTIGWILLIQTTAFFIMILTGKHGTIADKQPVEIVIFLIAYWFALEFLILGVSVIILGQLVRFIIGQKIRPGLMLRRGSEILLFFAGTTVLWAIYIYQFFKPLLPEDMTLPALVIFMCAVGVNTSVLVLLSQIMKKVVPVIEEFKALV